MNKSSEITIPAFKDNGGVGLVYKIYMSMVIATMMMFSFIYFEEKASFTDFLIMEGILVIFFALGVLFKKYMTDYRRIKISYSDISLLNKTKTVLKFYRDDIKYITAYKNVINGKNINTEKINFHEAFENPSSALTIYSIIISKESLAYGNQPVNMTRINNSKNYISFQPNEDAREILEQFYGDKII